MFATQQAEPAAWDDGLDEAQLHAATHGLGPLVIVAGAGTGKTRTLTARLACLLDRGVLAQRVLLLTFTRRAADEMLARAARVVGLHDGQQPLGGTFHAVAHAHIAAYAEILDLPKGFGVLDPAGACDLIDLLRSEHHLTGTAARFPRSATLVEIYSRCINNDRSIRELVPLEYPWCEPHLQAIAELFRDFTARKRRSSLLDFDDLLLYWRALLRSDQLGPQLAERFSYVLVDEFQDVNPLQAEIVRLLAPGGEGLTIAGDQGQAIYGFRGSDPKHLRRAVASYSDATVIRLERNFRSRQALLEVANRVRPKDDDCIRLHSERGKGCKPRLRRCHDAASEARAVVNQILELHQDGGQLRDQAILVRAAHHSDLVELELAIRKVPFRKYGGLRFLEAAHVKDFVAAARLLENSHDEVAWYRVLRLHHNIGPSRARALVRVADPSRSDALARWPEIVAHAPPSTRGSLSDFFARLAGARNAKQPGSRVEAVLAAVIPLVRDRYGQESARLQDLERLAGAAATIQDLPAWLANLTLDPPASTGDLAGRPHLDEDYVVISTIHSAKGLEWPVVHLPYLVDGAIPSDLALKSADGLLEEHRLFYVAITRARDHLFLYAPLRMPHHRRARDDRHSLVPLSRFLSHDVCSAMEVSDEPARNLAISAEGVEKVVVDIDQLWA